MPTKTRKPIPKDNGHRYRRAITRQKHASQICHICGQPIDLTLRSPHPRSFALDHIVPLAAGGDMWNPTNHASSHRECNRAKSDGPLYGVKTLPTSRAWL